MPRWLKVYLALVPVFPPLYLAGFWGLGQLRRLKPWVRWTLFAFLLTQLAAALLSPNPLPSLVLALVRALFILGLIGVGVWLKESQRLGYLLYGYVIVYLVAFWTSWQAWGEKLFDWARLVHPYYTTVSIGLAGALGILLAAGSRELPRWFRLLGGGLALLALLFSGSRGALLLLVTGGLAALALGGRRYLSALAAGGGALLVAYLATQRERPIHALARILDFDNLNGRDKIWAGALRAFHEHPVGGTGPYQLGPYLDFLHRHGCHLWIGAERLGLRCPEWLEPFYGAWLIAHNTWLHALGETGVVGTVGWALLYLLGAYATIRARDPLAAAIFFGFLAMGLVDNPTLVPSLSPAEAFWVALGTALARGGLAVATEELPAGDVDEPGLDAPQGAAAVGAVEEVEPGGDPAGKPRGEGMASKTEGGEHLPKEGDAEEKGGVPET